MFILIDVMMQIIRSLVLILRCDAVVPAPEGQPWSLMTFMDNFYVCFSLASTSRIAFAFALNITTPVFSEINYKNLSGC